MIGAPGANYIVQTLKYASTLTSNLAAPEAASLSFCFSFGVLIFDSSLASRLPNSEIGPNRPRLGVELPPARSPCNLLSGQPCHPSFCSVFHLGPCFPQYMPPIGQDLRLTIVSTDDDDSARTPDAGANKSHDDANKTADEKPLDSIPDMYVALRACWTPPPKDDARHGMEYTIRFAFKRDGEIAAPLRRTYSSHEAPDEVRDTYRDAVDEALKRCAPLHFSTGMSGAVAGRPIAIRFVDERTLGNQSTIRNQYNECGRQWSAKWPPADVLIALTDVRYWG